MVKKLLCTLVFFILCIADSLATTRLVNNADGFKDAALKSVEGDTVRLMADIDLAGYTMPEDFIFSGVIDGSEVTNGDTVCHIIKKSRGKDGIKDKDNSPLFETVKNATFQNVCIYNFRVERDNVFFGNDDLGAIARTATNTTFRNIIFSDISVFSNDDYAGAVAGHATECTFYNVNCLNCDVTVDGDHAGGLVGYSEKCTYTSCMNNALSRVFADGSNPNAYAGGITGESNNDTFNNCVNLALIGANDDRVGGISGYSTNTTFQMCTNSGHILQVDDEDYFNAVAGKFRENLKTFDENYQENLAKYKNQLNDYYDTLDDYTTITRWSMFGTLTAWMVTGMVAIAITNPVTLAAAVAATVVMVAVWAIEGVVFNFSAHDELGGICGAGRGLTFDCCANYGGCYSRDQYVGGIIGLEERPGMSYEYSEFKNCLNAGEISGYTDVGGIAGKTSDGATFSNCLSAGDITGRKGYHKICSTGTKTNCYYRSVFYSTKINNETGVTDEQLESGQVAYWLNGGSISADAPWRQTIGADKYPKPDMNSNVITPDSFGNRIVINSADDLKALADTVNGAQKQSSYIVYFSNDIDLKKYGNWIPIGNTREKKFIGLVYGNGHTVSNLKCETAENGAGLFGNIGNNTEIHDIILDASCQINSTSNGVGGIVGRAEDDPEHDGKIVISGCGNMAGIIKGNGDVGGIIGAIYTNKNMSLKMSNCFNAAGEITSETGTAAAMCGFAKTGAELNNCWNYGQVSMYESDKAFVRSNDLVTINNCYQYEGLEAGMKQPGVNSFSSQDLADGTLCYKLNGQSNITGDISALQPWEQNLGMTGSYPVPTAYGSQRNQAVYYSRNIAASSDTTFTIGTIVLPFEVASNDTIRYYVLDDFVGENSSLHFTAVEKVSAGTPALFLTDKTGCLEFISSNYSFGYEDLELTKIQPAGTGWTMQGTYESRRITDSDLLRSTYYISGNRIKSATNSLTIGSFRAYLTGPDRELRPATKFVFDSDGTPYITLNPAEEPSDNNAGDPTIYNTVGQQMLIPVKGINIIDGSKYYIE